MDTPLPPSVHRGVVSASVTYAVEAHVEGPHIELAVEQSELCTTKTTDRVHRNTTLTRVADPRTTRSMWVVAIAGTSLGAFSYANADGLAESAVVEGASAGQYRAYGVAGTVVGLVALVVATIDSVRAMDGERDDGVVTTGVRRERYVCRHARTRGRSVSIDLLQGRTLSGRLDERGRVLLSLSTISDAELPTATSQLRLRVATLDAVVTVSAEQWAQARAALLRDPTSRLAVDVLERRLAECANRTAVARRIDDALPAQARAAWDTAKQACGDLWTQELELEVAEVERRLEARRYEQELAALAEQLDVLASSEDAARLLEALAQFQRTCSSPPHLASARQLSARSAARAKLLEREERARAKRIAREEQQRVRAERRKVQRSAAPPVRAQRSWSNARLLCNDGTLSPSCTCGRSSYRGCCSWHGGVDRCSVEQTE